MKTTIISVTAAAVLCLGAAIASQEGKATGQLADAGFQPSADAMALMSPGPMHQHLDALAGDFSATGKWRMGPQDPWQEWTATIHREWILGGRFLQETVESEFMGQPFQGMSLLGYDNLRKQYDMVWVENMSTATYHSTGHADASGKVFTFEGQFSNQMTGEEDCWARSTLTIESADEHSYEGFGKDASGKEYKNAEMVEQRL